MLTADARIHDHAKGLTIHLDHWVFILSAATGAVIIFVLKSGLLQIPHADALGIIAPVTLMASYALMVTIIPRTQLRLDQAGDNLYYLGFTYTLCSLAITLYRFHSAEGAADYIVSNFGIALATTIAGVVARVWLHQMREDPLELEREARSEIADAVSRLRAEIDQAVREFNHFNRTLQQSAKEAIEAQGQIALEMLDKSTKQYGEVTLRALGYIESCFSDFQKQAGELNTNSQRIATALDGVSKRIDGIEAPKDLLSEKLAPIFEKIAAQADELNTNSQRIATALASFSKRIDGIEAPKDLLSEKLAPIFEKIAEQAEQTVGRVSSERQRNQNVVKLIAQLDAVATTIDSIGDKIADKEGRIATALQQAVALVGQTAELTRHVGQWTQGFVDIEARQHEILAALSRALVEAQDRDRTRDESLRNALDESTRAIAEYETRSQSLLQRHSELFEAELQRAERTFKALAVTLSEGAELLTSELAGRA